MSGPPNETPRRSGQGAKDSNGNGAEHTPAASTGARPDRVDYLMGMALCGLARDWHSQPELAGRYACDLAEKALAEREKRKGESPAARAERHRQEDEKRIADELATNRRHIEERRAERPLRAVVI